MVSSFAPDDKREIDTPRPMMYNEPTNLETGVVCMQIISDRRALHRIPELERQLPETMVYLKQALSGLGCKVFSPMESALCAWFDFGKEEAIAFRADCDALPIAENSGKEYASCHPGMMHACGHDGHMAILLELARRMDKLEDAPHNVLLLFQPAEENTGGAQDLCRTGVLERCCVKAVFGLHIWPGLEKGQVFSRCNEMMSRSCEVNIDIYGKSAHIAKASQGIDAVAAGVEFYRRATQLEQSLPQNIFRLLKFGVFKGGTIRNALARHVRIEGSLRAFQDEVFEGLRDGLYAIGRELEEEMGCRVEITTSSGYPAVMNPEPLYRQVRELVSFGELPEPNMASEDFSFYQKHTQAMFFFLGLGDTPALHSVNFDFDERVLTKGADFFETLARNF